MSVDYLEERREMVAAIRVIARHLAAEVGKATLDDRVLRAMAKVPRHEFVPVEVKFYAYLNRPLPIGFDKTISQPFMVALMTDLLELSDQIGLRRDLIWCLRRHQPPRLDLLIRPLGPIKHGRIDCIGQLRAGGRFIDWPRESTLTAAHSATREPPPPVQHTPG